MGKKKTRTETTTTPVYGAQIEGAANDLNSAYRGQRGAIQGVSDNLTGISGELFDRFREGDSTINAARGYIENELSGDPTQNPYLQSQIDQRNDSVRNQMQAQMGTRGQTGSSDYYGMISQNLAEQEDSLRYNDYNNAMQRRTQLAGMAPGVVAGEYIPLQAGMQAGQAGAMLPIQAAAANAAGTGGLLGQYTNQNSTQTSGGGFMDMLGMGLQAASVFCDARLKENASQVGSTPGGVPIYHFNYIGDDTVRVGPMAQEVAELQPEALGPVVDGYMTVNMGALN